MRARGTFAARARTRQTIHVAEARGLERRRGLISFLTWAFFLAEVFGRDGIVPSSAQAAEPEESAPSHGNGDAAPPPNELADRPMTGIGDPGEPVTIISPGYTLNLQTSVAEAGPVDIGDRDGQDAPAGHGVTPLPADAAGAAAGGVSPAAPDAISPGGAESAETPALLHVGLAPDGLLHGLADTLGELPLVGNLLGNTLHAVTSTVDNLVGGLGGLASSSGSGGGEDAVLASGGSLAFEPTASAAPLHELETPHGFTDYGIALELSLPGSSVLSLAPPSAIDVTSFSADHDASHLSVPADAGIPDDVGQRASADVLA
jgi:hypothetical protein